jgi:hypothetical protein
MSSSVLHCQEDNKVAYLGPSLTSLIFYTSFGVPIFNIQNSQFYLPVHSHSLHLYESCFAEVQGMRRGIRFV